MLQREVVICKRLLGMQFNANSVEILSNQQTDTTMVNASVGPVRLMAGTIICGEALKKKTAILNYQSLRKLKISQTD